ncbi:hypothetical protein KC19_8G201700 [Ceratodon purpureus]|uniref:TF-B3 domain-containing protein n=1 Tax=Ceratodon purpureus TaxID=3225 RepID=A0A8T0H5L4_CERPU|nr:hypothetical protein KC19_8G201700 [Ceratodon purpureus]
MRRARPALLQRVPGAMSTALEELVLDEIDETEAPYFTLRIISKTNPARLEVPASFTATTGWPGAAQCSLLTSLRDPKEWPLQMGQLPPSSRAGNAVSDSAGWINFLRHMPVSVGDILVFEHVDDRCLVASVAYHRGRRPQNAPEEPQVVHLDVPEDPQVLAVNVQELPQVVNVNVIEDPQVVNVAQELNTATTKTEATRNQIDRHS